jgi:shikimate kinase
MNVVDAYLKKKLQLIILISGFSGSGKTLLARQIERDFKVKFINLNSYLKEDYTKTVELTETLKIIDWDSPDAIDWNKFNNDINEHKHKGVVVSGFGFLSDKLEFKQDFHIHLKIDKDQLMKNRKEFLEENKDNKLYEISDEKTQMLILNKISYPHYLKYLDSLKIDKFIIAKEKTPDDVYDETFNYLIKEIEGVVYKKVN